MIDFLVKRNHNWENIIDGYPVSVVRNLCKVGREQDNLEHLRFVTGVSIAVTNAIDLSFNKGKGKFLDSYFKEVVKSIERERDWEPQKTKVPQVGKEVLALFNALPKKELIDDAG